MTMVATLTRGGRSWTPDYLVAIDPALCIGCGRCFKVCGRDVMTLMVRLTGACVGCHLSGATIDGVQTRLVEALGMPLLVIPVGNRH